MAGESNPVPAPAEPRRRAGERTIRLLLEYDGTDFAGWQTQPNLRTVQGVLEPVLGSMLEEPGLSVLGAGRTDSGTHAAGQVAHFRTLSRISPGSLYAGLNSVLPRDLRVRRVDEAPAGFHARFSAVGKEYRYHYWHGSPVPPFLRNYCYGVRSRLDVAAMARAAALLEGSHDLSSFRAAGCAASSPVRTVHESRVGETGPLVVYAIRARGFLQHMVRIIAGTLLRVGRGQLGVEEVAGLIAARDRRLAPATAPAHGLFLVRVEYPDEGPFLEALPVPVLAFSVAAQPRP